MSQALVTGLNGLSYAFILFLLAAGFSLTFGVMGVLNLAHGALYMLGAYIGLQVIASVHQFWAAVVVAAIALAIVGYALYWFFLKKLYNKVPQQGVLTIGVSLIIANVVLWIWGPISHTMMSPRGLTGAVHVGSLGFPIYRLFVVGIGVLVLALLWYMQDRTRVGAIIRAGMDNRDMTVSLGINYGLVSTCVFLLGMALAGVAGVIGAPITGAYPSMGDNLLLLTLIVVVVGGTGYIQGTMLGALVIGMLDTFGKAYIPRVALFFAWIVFLAILLLRPSGLIGRKVF